MKLKLVQHIDRNRAICGFIMRGSSVYTWMKELSRLRLSLSELTIYGLPDNSAKTIWGCLVLTQEQIDPGIDHIHEFCYFRTPNLIFPMRTREYPKLRDEELNALIRGGLHVLHPGIGLVELEDAVEFQSLIRLPELQEVVYLIPEDGVRISCDIHSLFVAPVDEAETLKELEKAMSPEKKDKESTKLSLWERIKLLFYRLFFKTNGEKKPKNIKVSKRGLFKWVEGTLSPKNGDSSRRVEHMMEEYKELEKRNQSELNKLLDMLENDPEKALQYAVPLDPDGSSRGGYDNTFNFRLSKHWNNFSLFGNRGLDYSGSGGIMPDDKFQTLQEQYRKTAEALKKQGKYEKAAFVYLKLLKNETLAAEVLVEGKLYKQAAALYLKMEKKQKAAECYEQARIYERAAELYKELLMYEKAGDLYNKTHKRQEAMHMYELELEDLEGRAQYVKAAKLAKSKMSLFDRGQDLLLEGWRTRRDAFNCLTYYLAEFQDVNSMKKEVKSIYTHEVEGKEQNMQMDFVQVLRSLYTQNGETEELKDLAFKIVSENAEKDRMFTSLLKGFNPEDKELAKDTLRYRSRRALNRN